jgi:hypothetical protein
MKINIAAYEAFGCIVANGPIATLPFSRSISKTCNVVLPLYQMK